MKHTYQFLSLSIVISFIMMSAPLTAQNTADACTTCKNFCSKFAKPLSFNALSTAMTELDEYCDDVQNPTSYDTSLCQKHSSLKLSFINKFSIKSSFMESLCGVPCKEECAPSDGVPYFQGEAKKQECDS
ncbi:MAG: hypothetical protein HYX35_04965 [Proteobacteria bacterium]|nr:hypothetical protein [Pseudomonadota bacterium]